MFCAVRKLSKLPSAAQCIVKLLWVNNLRHVVRTQVKCMPALEILHRFFMLTGLVFVFCGSGMIRFDNAIQWMQLSMKNEELLRNLVSVKWQESLRPSAAYLCMQSRCTVGGTLLTFPSSKCWMLFYLLDSTCI